MTNPRERSDGWPANNRQRSGRSEAVALPAPFGRGWPKPTSLHGAGLGVATTLAVARWLLPATTFCWLLGGLLGLSMGTATAQSMPQTFALAEQQYRHGLFNEAADAYRRVIFFDSATTYRAVCYQRLTDCLYQTRHYVAAVDAADVAIRLALTDSARAELGLQKLSCHLLLGEPAYANLELLNLPDSLPPALTQRQTFYAALTQFQLGDFGASRASFHRLCADSAARAAVDALFAANHRISRINPKKARRLSMILPGLGQLYVGDYRNGLNSLLLTGGLLFWGGRLLVIGVPFVDSLVLVMPWFQRYYVGGFNRAERLADAQIQRRRTDVYNRLLDVVATQLPPDRP